MVVSLLETGVTQFDMAAVEEAELLVQADETVTGGGQEGGIVEATEVALLPRETFPDDASEGTRPWLATTAFGTYVLAWYMGGPGE